MTPDNQMKRLYMEYCGVCGHWLSLGPANDEGCEVEIRAAEIAASLDDGGCLMSPFEIAAFNDEPLTLRGGAPTRITSGAGYLARVISTTHNSAGVDDE